jgi:hypothetical protein
MARHGLKSAARVKRMLAAAEDEAAEAVEAEAAKGQLGDARVDLSKLTGMLSVMVTCC